jgi:polyhydroxyalkanoate synthesis regulator phasin
MMNEEEMKKRVHELEAKVEQLTRQRQRDEEQFRHRERDAFSRNLTTKGFLLIIAILGLIALAIGLRYYLEIRRMDRHPTTPVASRPHTWADAPTGPRAPGVLSEEEHRGPAAEQAPDAKQALDNYVDRAPGKNNGGNSYSITLGGLREAVDGLVKAGQITAEKAAGLMEELGKQAIGTTGDILKETAKAVIARYLGPKPESKDAAGAPTQQVLVNVFTNEKQVTASRTRKPTTPAKPKSPCPLPVTDAKPAHCQAST